MPRYGIGVRYVDVDLAGIKNLVGPRTKVLYIETPTNPALRLVDLQKAASFAEEWGLVSVIDNTFATPVLQKPLAMGFNLVVHSATKYLAGHSDVIAGAAVGSNVLIQKVQRKRYLLRRLDGPGGCVPADPWSRRRSRFEWNGNARRPWRWPGTWKRIPRSPACTIRVCDLTRLPTGKTPNAGFRRDAGFRPKGRPFGRAAVLRPRANLPAGGKPGRRGISGSLPIYTSHHKMSPAELRAVGVEPGTVRISIGLEDPEDLIADLGQALK